MDDLIGSSDLPVGKPKSKRLEKAAARVEVPVTTLGEVQPPGVIKVIGTNGSRVGLSEVDPRHPGTTGAIFVYRVDIPVMVYKTPGVLEAMSQGRIMEVPWDS